MLGDTPKRTLIGPGSRKAYHSSCESHEDGTLHDPRERNREDFEAAIGEFLGAIRRTEPDTEYRAFRESNGQGYVHVMSFPDQAGEERHRSSPWTERFAEKLYPKCDAEPVFTEIEEIESFRKGIEETTWEKRRERARM